jgi:hypothetical protein
MSENPRIESRIQEILRGSRLPAERRAEVAEEFRGHLERLVEARRQANVDDAATEAALAAFGDVEVIRRHLRQRQGAEDHRQVLAAMRRRLRLLLIIPALFPLYIAIFASFRNGEVFRGVLFALVLYAAMLVGGFVVLYPFVLARIRAGHRLPAGECHPLVDAVSWFAIFVFSLALSGFTFACGFVGAFGVLGLTVPKAPVEIDLARLLWDSLKFFVPAAGPFLLMIPAALALALVGVQRWRCMPGD